MFRDPQKHVLIAITQSKMVEESYEFDEVLDVARGVPIDGQKLHESFENYLLTQVEQDDRESIASMIEQVNGLPDIRQYVHRGFFDYSGIKKIFDDVKSQE